MSDAETPGFFWLNGGLVPTGVPCLVADDRGVTLGDGLYETIAAAGGAPLRLTRHLARLRAGIAVLGIPLALSDEEIEAALTSVLAVNGLADAALRLTLTRGAAPRGLLPPKNTRPTLLIAAAPPPVLAGEPVTAIVASVTRRNEASPLSRLKTLNALDNILARREAAAQGAGEALLLNVAGRIAESTIANLFVVLGGRLLTPPLADGALPGVRRAELLESGRAAEMPLSVADVLRADEAFLTNSLTLRPLTRLDAARIGSGDPGPVFRELCAAYGA